MTISDQREFFSEIKKHPDRFYIVHYSCQSLYDDNEGLSPRITSIAVVHYATDQAISFSTHSTAEELGIPRADVVERFDEIETALLTNFFDFVRDRRDRYWVHWNMRNITYGFEHIEHRYRALTHANPPTISVERRINLNDMLGERFGDDYAPHQKMINLMEMNGGRHRFFLTGPEEVAAFQSLEFIRMHQSCLVKAEFFQKVIGNVLQGGSGQRAKAFFICRIGFSKAGACER
jgi:hypothetical protein